MSARKNVCATWLLGAAVVVATVGTAQAQREAPRPEVRGIVKSIDAAAGTITLTFGGGRDTAAAEKTFALAKNVEVAVGTATRIGVFKEAKVADLAAGSSVALALSADQKMVDSIVAEGPTVRGQIKALDATKRTITIGQQFAREPAGEDKTYTVAADAEIALDDGRGRRFSMKEAQLADLSQGAMVAATLSIDQKNVYALVAEGPTLFGTIKSLDAGKKTVTLDLRSFPGAEAIEERTLTIANNATVLLDDGKGRRLSLKETKLDKIPAGSAVAAKLSLDQSVVMSLRAEGPILTGFLKAVDAGKNAIVIAIPKVRGEAPEEKNFSVAKDARISIDGADSQLASLKVGDNATIVQVRLTLDQSAVQLIVARTNRER